MNFLIAIIYYIGCYADAAHPNGLRVVDFDSQSGEIALKASYPVVNPHYFDKSSDGKVLYMHEADGLSAWRILDGGLLEKRSFVSLKSKGLCHVALMPSGDKLCWASYTDGESGIVAVKGDQLGEEIRRDRHYGKGSHPRQEKSHCHQALPTPDGKGYCVVDLGLDSIFTYPAEAKGGAIPFGTSPAGAGPRHLVFHPNGKLAFVVFELGNRIASYRTDSVKGFIELDNQPTLPPEWKGDNSDAAIRLTPDLKRVVVSNRGYDSLTVFDYDRTTGKLTFVARSVLPGSWPRDFIFVPGTDYVLVTQERSGTVLSARYDAKTGKFTPISTLSGLFRPVAVLQ